MGAISGATFNVFEPSLDHHVHQTSPPTYTLRHQLTPAQVDQLVELYRNEWWCKHRTKADVQRMLAHVDLLFALVDNHSDTLIAFARVLTDFVYKALVFDVIVHPKHRGRGLGDALMRAMFEADALRNVQSIELYCLPEMAPFYDRFGFSVDDTGCVFLRRRHRATPP